MSTRSWYLVCYGVRDDTRLRRTARPLEGYGDRLQYSVFRCRLTQREEERLRWELTKMLENEDAWLIVPVCDSCVSRLRLRDTRGAWPAEPGTHVTI